MLYNFNAIFIQLGESSWKMNFHIHILPWNTQTPVPGGLSYMETGFKQQQQKHLEIENRTHMSLGV